MFLDCASGVRSKLTIAASPFSSSLCSDNSVYPLKISEDAFLKLQQTYEIDCALSDLAHSFGDKPLNAEAGYGGMTVTEKKNGIHGRYYNNVQTKQNETNKSRLGILIFLSRRFQNQQSLMDHATSRRIPPPRSVRPRESVDLLSFTTQNQINGPAAG